MYWQWVFNAFISYACLFCPRRRKSNVNIHSLKSKKLGYHYFDSEFYYIKLHYSKPFILENKISSQYMEYNYSLSINKSYFLPCTQSKTEQEGTNVASFLLCVPLFKLILRRPNCISHVLLFSHVNIYHAIILSMNVSF